MPVDELPVAVDAPVDMGDPDHHVTQRPAVDADVASFEADRIGQISAVGDDSVLHVYGIGAGERLPTQAKVSVTRLCPFSMGPHAPNTVTSSETAQESM
jgi:hypothetical protein